MAPEEQENSGREAARISHFWPAMSVGSDGERLTISKLAAAAGLDPRDPEQLCGREPQVDPPPLLPLTRPGPRIPRPRSHEALEGITVLRLDWQRIKLLEHMELVPSVHDLYLQHVRGPGPGPRCIQQPHRLLTRWWRLCGGQNAIRSMRPLESLTQLRFVVLSHNQINRVGRRPILRRERRQ